MPIYEFECKFKHRFEKLYTIRDCPDIIECEVCEELMRMSLQGKKIMAEKIWSLPGNIQLGSPTKMFVNNRTGEVYSPSTRYDKPPKGYHEIELRNPIERSKFEREQQRRLDAENQLTSHVLDSMKSESRKKRHDDLKARLNSIQKETYIEPDGKEKTIEFTLDHKDKQLLSKAMERSNKKPRKEKKTDVKLAINHYNPSNLDQVK